MKKQNDKEGVPQTGSNQQGTPKNESSPDNIKVAGNRDGSGTDHPTLVPKVVGREVKKMAFSLKDVALPPKSAEPYRDVIGTLEYRRAKNNEYFRVRADPKWKAQIGTTLDRAGNSYIVGPEVMEYLEQERLVTKVDVFYLISKDSHDIFLSGIGINDPEQKENSWNTSRRKAYAMAETKWIRIVPNHSANRYNITEALGENPEPDWPDDKIPSLEFALNMVFENRLVDTMAHEVIKGIVGKRL